MADIVVKDILEAGIHYGHRTSRWNPKMRPYIYGRRNLIHIIDVKETIRGLMRAKRYLKQVAANGSLVLFVGTKRQAVGPIAEVSELCGMPFVNERWLGGTLTNFSTIKKSIKRLKLLEKEGSNLYNNLTKKETQTINREKVKLADQHRGIKDMRRLPDAVLVVDAQYENTAIREAKRLDIPVIAIVDSNTDPEKVDYPIPANDDSIRTIQLIVAVLADAVNEAKGIAAQKENDVHEDAVDAVSYTHLTLPTKA